VGTRFFRTCTDRPWGPSSLLYNGYRVFPWGKERRGVTLTPHLLRVPWSWKVRAIPLQRPYGPNGLYIASVPVQGCTLLLPYLPVYKIVKLYHLAICVLVEWRNFNLFIPCVTWKAQELDQSASVHMCRVTPRSYVVIGSWTSDVSWNDVRRDIKDTSRDINGVSRDINDVRRDISDVIRGINDVSRDLNDIIRDGNDSSRERNDVSRNRNDVRRDINDVKREINEVRRDRNDVRRNINDVSRDINDVKSRHKRRNSRKKRRKSRPKRHKSRQTT